MAFFSLFLLKRTQLPQTLAKLLNTRLIANRVCEMRRITLRWYFRMEELNSARKWQTFNILRLTFQVRQFLTHLRLASFSEKDPLLRQLYEFDEQVEDLSQGVRPMSRALWKNRHHVTVTELSSSFQREVLSGGGKEFKVLDAFLKQVTSTYCCKGLGFCATKIFLVILTPFSAYISGSVSFLSLSLHAFPFKQIQEHKLRFVQFLPDVVRLQRLLMNRFHRRIDRTDAENYTVREFLKEVLNKLKNFPQYGQYYGIYSMQKVDVLSCFSNSMLRLAGAPFPVSFLAVMLNLDSDGAKT